MKKVTFKFYQYLSKKSSKNGKKEQNKYLLVILKTLDTLIV